MLTHRALLADLEALLALEPAPMRADDVALAVLPLFHIYGLNAVLGLAASVGATVVLAERFDPQGTLDLIAAHEVTNVAGAPPMYVAWSRVPEAADVLRSARLLVTGAAALAPSLYAHFDRLGITVWEGYGLTETAPVVTATFVTGRAKPGSVGAPLPGVEVRLVDDDGTEVDEGDPGVVQVRGDLLFSGYWPDGAEGPDAEGWWSTGDVAYADADGDLHLVDRRRDLVIVNGFNVFPFEVETVLMAHADVAEAAVIGIPDPQTGEAVVAYVVPLPGATLWADDLLEHCRTRLAKFKCPSRIEVVTSLPHSTTGKVARSRLRERFETGRG